MPRPVIRAAGRGRALEIGPTRATIKLAGAEAGDRLGVVELEFGPGFAGPPRHRHRETDHAWYVLTGQLEVSVNGQQRVLAAGDFAFIPRGTRTASPPTARSRPGCWRWTPRGRWMPTSTSSPPPSRPAPPSTRPWSQQSSGGTTPSRPGRPCARNPRLSRPGSWR